MTVMTTGISELDRVLGGGLRPGSLVVIAGAPGSGKTILAQQICFANASPEHKAIYYTTLSEPQSKLVRHLEGFTFFDSAALESSVEFNHLAALADADGRVAMETVSGEVVRRAFDQHPSVIVIDSSKALHETEGAGFRQSVYDLAARVAHTNAILVLVGEYELDDTRSSAEFAVADAIIYLANEAMGPKDRRWLRVLKLRGSSYMSGQHTFRVTSNGLSVYPRPEAGPQLSQEAFGARIESGIAGLDSMLGGGMPARSLTLLAGPSGAGKTVMSLQFLMRGLAQGEACVYASFQESERQLISKAAHFGWDFDPDTTPGKLALLHMQPVELGLDVVASELRRTVRSVGARRVVIDSLAELQNSAPPGRFADYLWSVIGELRAEGATIFITSETKAFFGPHFELAQGLSYIADNVVLLRYLELDSEIRRALVVVKMRDSDHEKSLVEFEVGPRGAEVKGKFSGVAGVLSGTPTPTEQKFREFFGR